MSGNIDHTKKVLMTTHKRLLYLLAGSLVLFSRIAFAQAPNITYNTPINVYTVGTAITNLVPTNTGGSTAPSSSATSVSGPSGMTIGPLGNLYVTQYNNSTVTYYSSGVVYVGALGSGYTNPDGIVFDSSGNAYVVDSGTGDVYEITSGGVKSTIITGLSTPYGIAIDASNNLYVTNTGSNQIRKYSTAGTLLQTITTSVSSPTDVRVDPSGNIYSLNAGTNNVTKYTSAGVYSSVFATGFNGPFAIGISSTGNVYVGDSGNNRVDIYNSAGTLLNTISVTNPEGIAIDAGGDVYISSYSGNKIYEYPPLGGYVLTGTLPAGLSFNTTTGTISGTPTASSAATVYTVTAYNSSGSSSTTVSIACGVTVAWTAGSNTTAWATGGNWSTGSAPGVNDAVSIGVSAYIKAKEPAITAANVTVGSITFGNSGGSHTLTVSSLTAGSLVTLTISGNLTVPTGVTPTITGLGPGMGAVNIAPGAIVNIAGTGKLTLNSTPITALLSFTLKSNATGSASVGQITATSIAGTAKDSIHVERYITGGAGYRGYRLMSSPVYAATVSANNVYSINYLHDHVFLTGTLGTTNGFDKTGNPTIYLFREDQAPSNATFTSGNFWGISKFNVTSASHSNYNYYLNGGSTAYNLPVGGGFMLFFRGDRTTASPYVTTTTPVASTVTATGTLNIGQVIVHDWYTPASANLGWTNATANTAVRGFNLVGNPYASSIDWEQYNTTTSTTGIYTNIVGAVPGVGNTIYELNPATNNYDTYQVGGAYTNNGTRTIVSGQAFFVLASSIASPQLIFNESAKSTTQNTGLNLFMATKGDMASLNNAGIDQHLRLQLAMDSVNTDDIYVGFASNASAQFVDDEDAPYRAGSGKIKMASYSSDHVLLAINKMPFPGQKQTTIPLFVTASAYGTYKLIMTELKGIPQIYEVWLMDAYKNDSLDMRHNTTYAFDISADTNSYGKMRFQLVIRQDPALGLHLLNFTAAKVSNGAQVVWKTENEQDYTNFTVERSTDNGVTFDVLGGFASDNIGTYSFLDKNPEAANQYRLKLQDLNNNITYSKIITLMYANSNNNLVNNNLSIYPNPAKSTLNLSISQSFSSNPSTTQGTDSITKPLATVASTLYGIKIVSSTGSIMKMATTTAQDWQTDVSGLMPGTYIIQVIDNHNNSLVGKGTFVKL